MGGAAARQRAATNTSNTYVVFIALRLGPAVRTQDQHKDVQTVVQPGNRKFTHTPQRGHGTHNARRVPYGAAGNSNADPTTSMTRYWVPLLDSRIVERRVLS